MIERHPIASNAHGCYVTSMSKKDRVYREKALQENGTAYNDLTSVHNEKNPHIMN